MRVMFLTPYFRPYLGGIERAVEKLALQIQKSPEVEAVGVLTTKYSFPRTPQPNWADQDTTPEGICIFRLSGYPKRSIPLHSVPLVWFSPLRIRSYLLEFQPDVIHFVGDGWFWGHFWAWFWFRSKARIVFTPSFHTLSLSRWWLRPINGFICNVVDRVIGLTQLETDRVRRAYWISGRKLGVIGWGATAPALPGTAIGDSAIIPAFAPLTILCVGRLGKHKGQAWLLNVYQKAKGQFDRPTRLVLVGRDEGGASAIVEEVSTRGLDGEVLLTGEISDGELAAWYTCSDLFALFSQYEAFGLVFFEAMAHGVPVLTHDVGANRELLLKGAQVVPRFSVAAAVQGLVRLVNDSCGRALLGREAREYALSAFTWPEAADKYLREYSEQGAGGPEKK